MVPLLWCHWSCPSLPAGLVRASVEAKALARTVAAYVPLDLHDAAPHPSSRTLPGLDLDARGVVARRDAGAPVGAALVPAFDARRAALLEHARDVAADMRDDS